MINKLFNWVLPPTTPTPTVNRDVGDVTGLDWEKLSTPGHVYHARMNWIASNIRGKAILGMVVFGTAYIGVVATRFPMNIASANKTVAQPDEFKSAAPRINPDLHALLHFATPNDTLQHLSQLPDPTTPVAFKQYVDEQLVKLNSGGKLDACDVTDTLRKPWTASDGSVDRFVCKNSQEDVPHTWLMTVIKQGDQFKPWMGFVAKVDGKWTLRQLTPQPQDVNNIQVNSSFASIAGIESIPAVYLGPVLKKDFKDFPVAGDGTQFNDGGALQKQLDELNRKLQHNVPQQPQPRRDLMGLY